MVRIPCWFRIYICIYIYMYIVNLYPRDRVSYPTKTLSFLQDAVPMAPLPPTANGGKWRQDARNVVEAERNVQASMNMVPNQGSLTHLLYHLKPLFKPKRMLWFLSMDSPVSDRPVFQPSNPFQSYSHT